MTPLYELQGVVRRYGDRVALDVPELAIHPGEIVGLVGPNGSGKSTLLRTLAFLDPPDEGMLLFRGAPACPATPELRRQATLLLQEPYLLKTSIFENVAYGVRLRGEKDPVGRVRKALEAVGLDYDAFARRPWHALSGGEAQRVALASRLALRPAVLLLDEPTAPGRHHPGGGEPRPPVALRGGQPHGGAPGGARRRFRGGKRAGGPVGAKRRGAGAPGAGGWSGGDGPPHAPRGHDGTPIPGSH